MKKKFLKKIISVLVTVFAITFLGCGKRDSEIIMIQEEDNVLVTNESINDKNGKIQTVIDTNEANKVNDAGNYSDGYENDFLHSFVVYVCGEVKNPGVYELNEGQRIIDAIEAAGGFDDDASIEYLNLALSIQDGDKIYVPSFEEIEKISNGNNTILNGDILETINIGSNTNDSNNANGNKGTDLVNLNTASESELMTLPGIGESKANAIISYRNENGNFNKIEDLMNIRGIKEGLFNKVKDRICVR